MTAAYKRHVDTPANQFFNRSSSVGAPELWTSDRPFGFTRSGWAASAEGRSYHQGMNERLIDENREPGPQLLCIGRCQW